MMLQLCNTVVHQAGNKATDCFFGVFETNLISNTYFSIQPILDEVF